MARAASPTPREELARRPCIGLLETATVARGIEAADAILWRSEVAMLFCEPVSPGKFVSLFTGEVEEVRSSLLRGAEVAGDDRVDELLLPNVEATVAEALAGRFRAAPLAALGVIETSTVASTIVAADVACKTAAVVPVEIRLANALGGKAFVTLAGEVGDVRAAVHAGAESAASRGRLVREVVIARAHAALERFVRGDRR
ncbi:MAG TPA: BMC domain-containing protein [Planctomycetota bacterium]|nr:BMC domain-containing protein [Planctomycetota bacterium]